MNEEDEKLQDLYAIYETSVGGAQHKGSVCTSGLSMRWYLIDFTLDSQITSITGKKLQREVLTALERESELTGIGNARIDSLQAFK